MNMALLGSSRNIDSNSHSAHTLLDKVELLRTSIEEVQKYELLTTNHYLQQMELLLEILEDISAHTDTHAGTKNTRRGN